MIRKRYQCPQCHGVFDYDHHPSIEADPVPRYCPNTKCNYDTQGDEPHAPALVAPHIGRPIAKATDTVYRESERGSEFRAQLAQENFGMTAEEASQIRITNMRDNAKEGEDSVISVPDNPVSRMMESAPNQFGWTNNGLGYSQSVSEGVNPNAGLRTQSMINKAHKEIAYDPRQAGAISSHLPAVETQVAGYRKRI